MLQCVRICLAAIELRHACLQVSLEASGGGFPPKEAAREAKKRMRPVHVHINGLKAAARLDLVDQLLEAQTKREAAQRDGLESAFKHERWDRVPQPANAEDSGAMALSLTFLGSLHAWAWHAIDSALSVAHLWNAGGSRQL